jgi:serine protease Do
MSRRPFMLLLALAVALGGWPVIAVAQDDGQERVEQRRNAWRTYRARSKNNPELKDLMAEVGRQAGDSVVRVWSGDTQVALGTAVGQHEVLTKASELGDGSNLKVRTAAGDESDATVRGVWRENDLALLRVPGLELPPLTLSPNRPDIGTILITPGPAAENVQYGIVSVERLKVPGTAAFLGVAMENHPDGGVRIIQVTPFSSAERAGLETGDIIVRLGRAEIDNQNAVRGAMRMFDVGQQVPVVFVRDDRELTRLAILGSRPRGSQRSIEQNQFDGAFSLRAADFEDVIQHDTVLLPLDMGGPVVSLDGRVVGINIARAGRVETFALPAEQVDAALRQLRAGRGEKLDPAPPDLTDRPLPDAPMERP